MVANDYAINASYDCIFIVVVKTFHVFLCLMKL